MKQKEIKEIVDLPHQERHGSRPGLQHTVTVTVARESNQRDARISTHVSFRIEDFVSDDASSSNYDMASSWETRILRVEDNPTDVKG